MKGAVGGCRFLLGAPPLGPHVEPPDIGLQCIVIATFCGNYCHKYVSLLQIERIQNPYLYRLYMTKKAEMDARNPGVQNEKRLWHGTASNNVQNINTRNFNRSYGGVHGAYTV